MNLPIPQGERAKVNAKWFISTAPYALAISVYRLIPCRANWNRHNDHKSTSHLALAAVLAPGGGRKAFVHYAKPQFKNRQYGFAMAWLLFFVTMNAASWTDAGPE